MTRRRVLALTACSAASLLSCSSVALAKSLTVSGKLDRAGYGVVALGYNGKVAMTRKQSFSLKVPDSRYTLQLLSANGTYGGPVIVGYKGKAALEGLTKSIKLGTVKVLAGAGYAIPARAVPSKDLDLKRLVNTKGKAPIGNGRNFGFVRSRGSGGSGAGLDSDQDGVPNVFDVARNGHTVLNAFAASKGLQHGVRATAAGGAPGGGPQFNWMSQIFLPLDETLNADAAGVTKAQIDSMLVQNLNVKGLNLPTADLIELDCGGLVYCKLGSSAEVVTGHNPDGTPQTAPLGVDSAGFAVLVGPGAPPLSTNAGSGEFSLMPRATSDQIQTGDTPILRTTTGGALTQTPVPIDFVFDTVPALAAYDDGAGDAGTISYPAPAGEPGTQSNPIPVAANASGDVVVTLKFWRPQRAGIAGAGEPEFMDIGHLQYTVDATSLAQAASGGPGVRTNASSCSSASLSPSDPRLSLSDAGPAGGFLVDGSNDAPANPANQLAFSIDLTRCVTDGGAPGFPVGAQGALGLKANAPGSADHAVQNIWIKRVR